MIAGWRLIVAAGLAVIGGAALAKPPKPLFASDELLRLTIRAPVRTLASTRGDAVSVTGTLGVAGATPETLPITLAPRGITRRRRDTCAFPPLRLGFPEKPGAASLFRGQQRLKLVTHCRPAEAFQQYLLLEYAAYRLYNRLTPESYAVRLARIDYIEADGRPVTTRLGFFIEATDDMARRNDRREIEIGTTVPVARLAAAAAARVAMFQMLIGNLDWAITAGPPGSDCCHNARLIGADAAAALTPVPYDFDFAGMVDAPYAVPPNALPLPNVRVRRYRGFCAHDAEARAAAALLRTERAALLATLDGVPELAERTRRKAGDYLEGFFALLATPGQLDKRILDDCLGDKG